jgi:peptide chain release factor 2
MEPLKKRADELKSALDDAFKRLKLGDTRKKYDELTKQMDEPDFWRSQKKASEISKEASDLLARLQPWEGLSKQLDDLNEMLAIADEPMREDLSKQLDMLVKKHEELKKELRFQGPYDERDVILSIHAGAGGTDAQDWAQMLLRMYTRWAEKNNLNSKTIDQTAGEEAGIKSVTLEFSGNSFLYAKLAGEHGVHRLVRLSPFNADHLRQTSFAKVEILPLVDKPEDIEIDEKELKIDVFRSGGAGGQSVNTTDSAVRLTHTPTGISVSVQNERSQLQNKQTAMAILRSKLVQLQLEQHLEHLSQLKGPNQSAEWGNQIRSYVLHPYKQVKDLRTGYETSDPQRVLDGDLDPLIEAWLEHKPASV